MAISFEDGVQSGVFEKRDVSCSFGHEPYFRITTGVCIECERQRSRQHKARKRLEMTSEQKTKIAQYMSEYSKEYNKREDVVERKRARERQKYKERKDYFSEKNRKYRMQNPQKFAFHASKSRRGKKFATPEWLSSDQLNQIERFYEHARDCTITVGEKYQVDHMVPLKGKNVCGLHVPWNLQVLPSDMNISKGNKMQNGENICF